MAIDRKGDLDYIVGVIHVKDSLLRGDNPRRPVGEMARVPLLVPGSLRLIEMLRRFQKAGTHLAIVLDEYGGTAGLVTLEDLLEEIVGSIEDEYPHPEPMLNRHPDGTPTAPGALPIRDLTEVLGVALPEETSYDTVAGFILHRLGHIPQSGEEVVYEGYRLVVQEMEAQRIRQVVIAPLSRGEESEHADRPEEIA